MNPTPTQPASSERYVTLRFCRWLLDPLRLRVYLWIVVCLATLIGVTYAAVNGHGARVWQRMRAELEAKSVQLDRAAFTPARVPDDQNFTMTPLLAPLFDFKPGTQEWRDTNMSALSQRLNRLKTDGPKGGGWMLAGRTDWEGWIDVLELKGVTNATTPPAQAVLDHLRPYEPILAEVREASRRPAARFNVRYEHEHPFEILLPHLGILRGWARVLALRASAHLALGHLDAAFEDLRLGLYLAETVRDEPILISQLVRGASVRSLAQPLWEGLADRRWTAAQARALQDSLERMDLWGAMVRALNAERAFSHATLEYVCEHPSILPTLGDSSPKSGGSAAFFFGLIPSGWVRLEQAEYHRLYQEFLDVLGSPPPRHVDPVQVVAATDRLDAQLKEPLFRKHRMFARMLIPAITAVVSKTANIQSVADQMALACALERYRQAHNRWPDRLEVLMPDFVSHVPKDMIRGGPLQYRPSGEGYTLYSLGWDGADNGGNPGKNDKGRWDMSTGDWSWRMP